MADGTQWVAMGYIKGAFGVKGGVKVSADTEYADSLLDYPQWRLRKDTYAVQVEVEAGKLNGSELQVKFSGTNDRDAAHALRGYTIEISRADFAQTEEGEYYWADLVGMEVVSRSGEALGTVSGLMETGAHDILIIDGDKGRQLIPFVDHFIDDVSHENRTITADWAADYQ